MITDGLNPINLLATLGAMLATGAGVVAVIVALALKRAAFARRLLVAGAICWGAYLLLLVGFSLTSRERTLARGDFKHLCEIDCHLAYAVTGVRTVPTTRGGERSVTVTVKVLFDSSTISAHRPREAPLTPGPRAVALVDDQGRRFELADSDRALTRALIPGESYTTDLAFEVPDDARGLRLDIESRGGLPDDFVIGYELSLLHKRTLLAVDATM